MSFDSSRLANSGLKSKRTFNSNNSDNNSNNKKEKSNQKTLGMAWGSNSLSSSRSSFRKSPFSNIGRKESKLQNQFDTEASSSSHSAATTSGRPIFHGVSIFVDDFTAPSKSGVPYQLDQLANNQPKLSDFFAVRSSRISEDTSIPAICQAMPEIEDSSFNDGTSKNTDSSELDESVVHKRRIRRETQDLLEDNNDEKMIEQPSGCRKSCEVNMAEPSSSHTENKSSVKNELESSLPQRSASVSSHCFNDKISESRSSTVVGPSKNPHSTLGDPNFVENYFKVVTVSLSRLSSGLRSHPELQYKAVAVCHSNNPKGTAEISSANYPARAYGWFDAKAGMFVRDAKALCPHLVILPYNFDLYEEVADQLYNILHKHCKKVQAVSCDEAFLDVTDLEGDDPQLQHEDTT
ncbi:hypothetical protein EZV62_011105 [Acer yangbiense]|uniref:UmuC domain-containing protein n=1 Tax=Acer yangbiense TaxID=1000413 RepID=A0A5C7I4D7_9ROSI|nr:hypothetical protein EZV62_011105 [Acer yangbiense]